MNLIHPIQFGEPVTLLRTSAAGVDDYGNDVITDAETEIADVAIWPRTSAESTGENNGDRDQTIIGLTILIPPGTDVQSTDQFRVRGALYDVDGEPGVWRSYLTDTRAGTQVYLTRVEG